MYYRCLYTIDACRCECCGYSVHAMCWSVGVCVPNGYVLLTVSANMQEDVFSSVGRPIIDSCMRGYNGTVFA